MTQPLRRAARHAVTLARRPAPCLASDRHLRQRLERPAYRHLLPTSGFFVATQIIDNIEFSKWIRFYNPLMRTFTLLTSIALNLMQILTITF